MTWHDVTCCSPMIRLDHTDLLGLVDSFIANHHHSHSNCETIVNELSSLPFSFILFHCVQYHYFVLHVCRCRCCCCQLYRTKKIIKKTIIIIIMIIVTDRGFRHDSMDGILLGHLFGRLHVVPNTSGGAFPCRGAQPDPSAAKNATHPQGIPNLEVRSCVCRNHSRRSPGRSGASEGTASVSSGPESLEVHSAIPPGSRFQHDVRIGEYGHSGEHRGWEPARHSQLDRSIGRGGVVCLCLHVAEQCPRRFGTNDGHASRTGRERTLGNPGRLANHSKGNSGKLTNDR